MSDIYDQHRAAFARVSAYVVVKDDARVATIAFKYPHDGAGRLYAYVHWLGLPMVRGFASGGGYDKRSAACAKAADQAKGSYPCAIAPHTQDVIAFWRALGVGGGYPWVWRLQDAGFEVWQAI